MISVPVIALVGGENTGKTAFYSQYTKSHYSHPTYSIDSNFVENNKTLLILVDTPGNRNFRSTLEYSWDNIFQYVDVILDFGNWSESEIYGDKKNNPKYMTWSGDNQETMKRIEEYLQGR